MHTMDPWNLNPSHLPCLWLPACRDKLIAATMDVYNVVARQLLPTPSKSHYVFNLRDFSRVIQGVQMQEPKSLQVAGSRAGLYLSLGCIES